MKQTAYLITDITFDFTDSQGEIDKQEQEDIVFNTKGVWYAFDEEPLIDKISDTTGWLISDIDFTTDLLHPLTSFK